MGKQGLYDERVTKSDAYGLCHWNCLRSRRAIRLVVLLLCEEALMNGFGGQLGSVYQRHGGIFQAPKDGARAQLASQAVPPAESSANLARRPLKGAAGALL